MDSQEVRRSEVEILKESSDYLRGKLTLELAADADHVSKDAYNLLKFHGTYQQDDRDARKRREPGGPAKHYMFMVRCRIPGGKLTAEQYLGLDRLADRFANRTLRLTTRQGVQFHGVLKKDLAATIAEINQTLLTTLGACGDVERNVMCCPAPIAGLRDELQQAADRIARHLAPRSRAYHEIWLDGRRLDDLEPTPAYAAADPIEPIYGKTYLPRKFKTGITLPGDNCIDIYAQDLGFVAVVKNGGLAGFNLLVGGGMGMSHGNPDTFPYLARPICHIDVSDLLRAAEAVVRLYRDHGNRGDRKQARIKYLLHAWGVPRFKAVLEEYFGASLPDPAAVEIQPGDLHLGWHPPAESGDAGFYGVSIENGRIKDDGARRLRTGLRLLVERFRPALRITANQDLLLCGLPPDARETIERTFADHGVAPPDRLSRVRQLSMACPAMPTCGLALTESERALPAILDHLERELVKLGLDREALSVRMTGCPNGCARPYQADIGIVGRSGDKYTLWVGGGLKGDRLGFPLCDLVPYDRIVATLRPLLAAFARDRQPAEGFGDYCHRQDRERLRGLLAGR